MVMNRQFHKRRGFTWVSDFVFFTRRTLLHGVEYLLILL